jgi:formylglycine-generating enzyme required for sulfatase activity
MQTAPLKTFIIYSHEDLSYKEELEKFLRHLDQKINLWSDKKINPGEYWDESIKQNLEEAEVILLLISVDFYNSEYIRETEFKRAKERFEQGKALIVPIIVRDCPWTSYDIIKDIQVLPAGGHSINSWKYRDQVFTEIANSLASLIDRLLMRRAADENLEQISKPDTPFQSSIPPSAKTEPLQLKNLNVPPPETSLYQINLPYTPEMIFVESGVFEMGGISNNEEKPVHAVFVPSFRIGKYPVTFDEYDRFCTEMHREKPGDNGWGRGQRPVINVSWRHVLEYCQWLSQKTGECYRLLSEAEWEFAARGGNLTKRYRYAGSNELDQVGWFWENSGDHKLSDFWDMEILAKNNCQTHPVGEKQPNELGICDLNGNVWEWCADHWHDNYVNAPTDGSAWITDGDSNMRLIRGGSWMNIDRLCRLPYRDRSYPGLRNNNTGFRVAQSL